MGPSRLWLRTVEQFRVRIPAEAAEVVPWLKATAGFQTEAVGFLGPHGQFMISNELPGATTVAAIQQTLARTEMLPVEAASTWAKFARFTAMSWPVNFSFEKTGRFAFGFPEDPRELEILSPTGRVAVYAVNRVLEVWKMDAWFTHVRTAAEDITQVIATAEAELRSRG